VKKNLLLGLSLLMATTISFAQDRTVSGKVTSVDDKSTLPGVNVVVKGTTSGGVTDMDGNFKITVPEEGGTLIFSFIGLETQEVEVGARSIIDVQMASDVKQLGEVVVTASGIEKSRDELGYTSTTVGGESLVKSGENGVLASMKGKIAGINITQNGGDPGAGSRITIRGATSITGNLQPLIVIDGVPMYNSAGGASTGGAAEQSRLNDLNPEDIESMEVLKGASAAALWGSRAANGVIMITTKTGASRSGRPFTVTFSSKISIDKINKEAPVQTLYGQGSNGVYDGGFGASSGVSSSWGDRISDRTGGADDFITDPNAPGYMGYFESDITGKKYYAIADGVDRANPSGGKNDRTIYDPYEALFKTAVAITNSVSVGSNNEFGNVFMSFSNLTQDGIIETNSNYVRNTARLNATRYLGDKLSANVNLAYTRSTSDRVNKGSNLSGLLLGGLRNSPGYDQSDYVGTYYDVNGIPNPNRQRAYRNPLGRRTNSSYDNGRWNMENVTDKSTVDRILAKFEMQYNPTEWLNFIGRLGYDSYTDSQDRYWNELSASFNGGAYGKYTERRTQLQGDFIATANYNLGGNIKGNVLLGASINDRKRDWQDGFITGFVNTSSPANLSNATADSKVTSGEFNQIRNFGYYGTLGFDFYDQLFVNLTGRLDAYSSFDENDNTFFYPAVDVAWQFSKLLPTSNVFSFGKLRGNWGQVGRAPSAYVTTTNYVAGSYTEGWVPGLKAANYGGGFRRSSSAGNPGIRPEIKTESELGTDLRFFKNKISLALTVYQNVTKDLIINVDVPTSSGFSSQVSNAAEIKNRGLEIEIGASIMEKGDFSWNLSANYAANRNEVVQMAGIEEIYLGGFISSAVVGEQLGVLYGAKWDRDESGNFVTDADGFPQQAATPGVVGDPNPTYTVGLTNTFTYKNFRLNVLMESVQGVDIWNGTKGALTFFGRSELTGATTTLTAAQGGLMSYYGDIVSNIYPANADGTYTVRGEVKDYGGGDVLIDEYFRRWGPGSGFTGPDEQFIENASWVRLRDVSLGYDFSDMFSDGLFSNFSLTFTGRNLGLWTNYTGVDPDTNLTGQTNAFGSDYFNNPSTKSYIFTLNITY